MRPLKVPSNKMLKPVYDIFSLLWFIDSSLRWSFKQHHLIVKFPLPAVMPSNHIVKRHFQYDFINLLGKKHMSVYWQNTMCMSINQSNVSMSSFFSRAMGETSSNRQQFKAPAAPLKAPINKCQFGVSRQAEAACVLLLKAEYSGETGEWTSGAWLLFIKSIND